MEIAALSGNGQTRPLGARTGRSFAVHCYESRNGDVLAATDLRQNRDAPAVSLPMHLFFVLEEGRRILL